MKLSTTQEKPATFEELVAVWGLLLTEAFVLFKLAPGDGVRLHWSREVVRLDRLIASDTIRQASYEEAYKIIEGTTWVKISETELVITSTTEPDFWLGHAAT